MQTNKEKGAVQLIEAALIFPIMFVVVFMMIMAGELYYQYSYVQYAVTSAALSGAADCENPMLDYIEEHGNAVPTDPEATDVIPYRYILTSKAKAIGASVSSRLESDISNHRPLLFKGMSPQNVAITGKPKMNLLVSSYEVQCDFDIEFPIRMVFSGDIFRFHYTVCAVETIGDPSEFVRNISLSKDLLERLSDENPISKMISAIKTGMEKVGAYIG